MKFVILDNKGNKKTTQIELSDDVWAVEPNMNLIMKYIYIYLANQRQANAKAKDRGEVSGGGRKPWRQKGTGRARAGSTRSPIWKGGGVTFGPNGEQNYKKEMNKKERHLAFKSALSFKLNANDIVFFDDLNLEKASIAGELINKVVKNEDVMVIHHGDLNTFKTFRNVKNTKVLPINEINPYVVMNARKLFITEEAAKQINLTWGKKN